MNRVFVYGTLRPGQRYHKRIERFIVRAEPAFVTGRLYHLPQGYPALVLERDIGCKLNSGCVAGDLLEFESLEAVLPILDELEDYYGAGDPRNLYERVTVSARTKRGSRFSAMVYVFAGNQLNWLERHAIPVPEGDWVRWRTERSRRF